MKPDFLIRSSSINLNTDLNNELDVEQANKIPNDSPESNKKRLYINVESKIDHKTRKFRPMTAVNRNSISKPCSKKRNLNLSITEKTSLSK